MYASIHKGVIPNKAKAVARRKWAIIRVTL